MLNRALARVNCFFVLVHFAADFLFGALAVSTSPGRPLSPLGAPIIPLVDLFASSLLPFPSFRFPSPFSPLSPLSFLLRPRVHPSLPSCLAVLIRFRLPTAVLSRFCLRVLYIPYLDVCFFSLSLSVCHFTSSGLWRYCAAGEGNALSVDSSRQCQMPRGNSAISVNPN